MGRFGCGLPIVIDFQLNLHREGAQLEKSLLLIGSVVTAAAYFTGTEIEVLRIYRSYLSMASLASSI